MTTLQLKIPPAVVFVICVVFMWLIKGFLPDYSMYVTGQKWVAYGCFTIGVIVGLVGVAQFAQKSTTVNPHRPENTSSLVMGGIYAISRNPMYLALLICLLAIALYWGNIFSLLIIPVFILYMNEYQIKPEEEMMEQKFGQKYLDYKKEVRRWL